MHNHAVDRHHHMFGGSPEPIEFLKRGEDLVRERDQDTN
jgi:hypothetical protein